MNSLHRSFFVRLLGWTLLALAIFTIAPAAQGDLSRWDAATHTLPDDSPIHEPDQGTVLQHQRLLKGQASP